MEQQKRNLYIDTIAPALRDVYAALNTRNRSLLSRFSWQTEGTFHDMVSILTDMLIDWETLTGYTHAIDAHLHRLQDTTFPATKAYVVIDAVQTRERLPWCGELDYLASNSYLFGDEQTPPALLAIGLMTKRIRINQTRRA